MVQILNDRHEIYVCLAVFLVLGYMAARMCTAIRLPPVLGMLMVGVFFNFFGENVEGVMHIHEVQLEFAPLITELFFFMVLLRAGLELKFGDVELIHILLGILPYLFDAAGIAAAAKLTGYAYTLRHGIVMGLIMACLGDGLVLPRVMDFKKAYPKAQMPGIMFVAAPMEATVALTLIGLVVNLAAPTDQTVTIQLIVAVERLVCTVVMSKFAISLLTKLMLFNARSETFLGRCHKKVFTGQPIEDCILLVGVSFAFYTFSHWVPNGFDKTGLFQPELCIILMASFFGDSFDHERALAVEKMLTNVWSVLALFLFTALGTRISFVVLYQVSVQVLPLLAFGIMARAFIVTVIVLIFGGIRFYRGRSQYMKIWTSDALFATFAGIPRATIQGALASKAVSEHAFEDIWPEDQAHKMQNEVLQASICTLAIMAPIGVIAFDWIGTCALKRTSRRCAASSLASDSEEIDLGSRSNTSPVGSFVVQ